MTKSASSKALNEEYTSLVNRFSDIFTGRKDVRGTMKGGCIREAVKASHYLNHLLGIESYGLYPLLNNGSCKLAAVDFDFKSDLDRIEKAARESKRFAEALSDLGLKSYFFEISKSGLVHLWLFFSDFVEARKVRGVLRHVAENLGIKIANGIVEIFPKQDNLSNGQIGNYIHLPYYAVLKGEKLSRRVIVNPISFEPLSLYDFLEEAKNKMISTLELEDISYNLTTETQESDTISREISLDLKSEKIVQICKKYWNEGKRQELSLSLSGFLAKNGMKREDAETIIMTISKLCGDNEINQRLASIKATYYKKQSGQNLKGFNALAEILSAKDLRALVSMFPPPKIEVPYPSPLDEKAYYGLAGEIVNMIEPHSEADPAALLLNFLTAFGNVIGDGAHFQVESDKHPMRLFCVLVGETSKGRKGTSWGHIKRLFESIDPKWARNIRSGLSSGEGIIWAVRDRTVKRKCNKNIEPEDDHEEVVDDLGVRDKRLCIMEGEFAQTLKILNREGNTLSPVLRNAWDTGNLHIITKNNPTEATGAHLSIIGHITRQELLKYLKENEQGNGFANRFLWICVRRSKSLPFGGNIDYESLEFAVNRLKEAIEFSVDAQTIIWSNETRIIWATIYAELSDGKSGIIGAITSRAEAYVIRLACIYALLDMSSELKPNHLEAALAVWEYAEASVQYIFQDYIGDSLAEKLYKLLIDNPLGLTRTEISNMLQRHRSSEEIKTSLKLLESLGKAYNKSEETEGRTRERWFAIILTRI